MPQIDAYDISVATSSGTLQNAAAATGNGSVLPLINEASCVMTVSGTFVGTVTFEGTEDGTIWAPILASMMGSSSAPATTATAPGTYVLPVVDLSSVRARVSAYTSGAITVTAHASELVYQALVSSGGGGGGGAATIADGADVAEGAKADAAWVSGGGSVIALLKNLAAALAGTLKVNTQGGIAATATLANVASSASSVTIQAANAARKGLIVVNDSASATLYLGYQATSSLSSFTEIVYPGQTWEMPPPLYNGLVSGIWSAAVGNARVTELT